jgi:excisionase family DNA binding protein
VIERIEVLHDNYRNKLPYNVRPSDQSCNPPEPVSFRDRPARLLDRPIPHTLTVVEQIEVSISKEWLSVSDICDYMRVSSYVVTSLLRSGELPGVKVGREWRVARVDLEEWINRQRATRSEP